MAFSTSKENKTTSTPSTSRSADSRDCRFQVFVSGELPEGSELVEDLLHAVLWKTKQSILPNVFFEFSFKNKNFVELKKKTYFSYLVSFSLGLCICPFFLFLLEVLRWLKETGRGRVPAGRWSIPPTAALKRRRRRPGADVCGPEWQLGSLKAMVKERFLKGVHVKKTWF